MKPQFVRVVVSPTSYQQLNSSPQPISLRSNPSPMYSSNPLSSIRLLSNTIPCNVSTTPTRIILTSANSTLHVANSIAPVKTDGSLSQKHSFLPALSTSPSLALTPSYKKVNKCETPTKSIPRNRKKTQRKTKMEETGKHDEGEGVKLSLF